MAARDLRERSVRLSAAAVLLCGAMLLGGCSTNVGELPFPAVHDMPPARSGATLNDAEQKKAEQELLAARNSVEARAQRNAQNNGTDSTQPPNTDVTASVPRKPAGQQAGGSRSP